MKTEREAILIISKLEDGTIEVRFNMEISAAEYGICLADVFKHFEKGRGKNFSQAVYSRFQKELLNPTSDVRKLS